MNVNLLVRLRSVGSRICGLFVSRRLDDDFHEEIESHLALLAEENIRAGMSGDEARRAARLRLGGEAQLRESHHDQRTLAWLGSFSQDIRFAFRMLRKNPGFTAIAVLTLALGIGANTAIFSVVNAVLLKGLPFPDAQRIVILGGNAGPILNTLADSPSQMLSWQSHVQSFEAAAAYQPGDVNLTSAGEPESVHAAQVSTDFFEVFGVTPALGQDFHAAENSASGVILSWSLWQHHYGGDSGIVGKPIEINAHAVTVVGVMPPEFQFPERAAIWVPQGVGDDTIDRGVRFSNLIARLRADTSLVQAQVEMTAISARARSQNKLLNRLHANATLTPMQENLTAKSRTPLLLLLSAVACVLLIACANVANLAFCRAANRHRELAVRSAIGARRARLIRQLLTESMLVALLGALLGVAFAFGTMRFLIAILPVALPRLTPITIDGRVLAFTALLCGVAAVISGLAPAISATRIDLSKPLKNTASISGNPRGNRIQTALMAVQIALSFVLLIGAGLMVRTLAGLLSVNAGFNPDNVLTINIPLAQAAYPAQPQVSGYYEQVFSRLKSLPDVDSVGAVNYLPLGGAAFFMLPISTPDHPFDKNDPFQNGASFFTVAGDYFHAMRIPLLRGRNFSDEDGANGTKVAIISESVASRFWPGQDAIGKQFETANQTFTVVAEVGDVHHDSLQHAGELEMYFPQTEMATPVMDLVVRFAGDPDAMIRATRTAILAVDKNQPVGAIQLMKSVVDQSVSSQRSDTLLLGIFGVLALALASIGCYGVVAYSVAQHTHEIGIRMALGARRFDVLRLAISRSVIAALIGMAFGAFSALALTRLMSTLLFGVSTTDPVTFALVGALLILMAFIACYVPARRAMRVDPMVALRHE